MANKYSFGVVSAARWIRRTTLLVLVAMNGVLMSPVYASIPVTIVAEEGDQAPGTPAGTTFTQNFINLKLNDAGEALVFASVEGVGVDSSNDRGVWIGAPGALQLLAREGQQAPGLAPGVVFGDIFSFPSGEEFDQQGKYIVLVFLAGPGITTDNDTAYWIGPPGGLQLLLREGDAAPGAGAGVTFDEIVRFDVNTIGDMGFLAKLTGSSITDANDYGIWYGQPGSLQLVIREGDAAPGLPASNTIGFRQNRIGDKGVKINRNGQIAFNSEVTGGGTFDQGLWIGTPSSLQLVARTGQNPPGTAPDVAFSTPFNFNRLNDNGELAFGIFLTGVSVTGADNSAVFAGAPGNLSLIIREGDAAPGGTVGETIFLGNFPGATSNDNSSITLSGGARFAGPGVTTSNDEGVWFGAQSILTLIAREGDVPPGVTDGSVLDLFGGRWDFNTLDQFAFFARLLNPGGGNDKGGVWLSVNGLLGSVLRGGDMVDLGSGPIRTVTSMGSNVFNPGLRQGGFSGNLNNNGDVIVDAQLNGPQEFALIISGPAGPTADAGPDQTEDEGLLVTLDGSGSTNATNYDWSQVAGPAVSLSSTTVVNPDFTTPYVSANTTLTFQLIVNDGQGNFSDPDSVNVTVVNVNNPPVADAGDDDTIKEGAVATLDGSNSFDPEGDSPLGYAWTQTSGPAVALQPSNTVVNPTFTAPLGVGNQLTFELVVDDGKESSQPDSVVITVVENSPPVADAGPDQTKDEGSFVQLDGTASDDPDGGDTISYLWTQTAGTGVTLSSATSSMPSFTAPAVGPGGDDLVFSLVVTDDDPVNQKSSAPDQVTISVRNINDPPSCDLARASCPSSKIRNNDGCTLWPPNHKLVDVTIDGVMDADTTYNNVTLDITGVTQDEPVNGQGDGDSSPDAVIQNGNPIDDVLIRSERSGSGNGRVYVVSFTADDGFESCTGSVDVGVPHNRKGTPVDDGQAYDSTQP